SASATCIVSINPTAPGSLTVTADYPGDTAHATITGNQTVNVSQPTAHSTSTTITCNPTSVVVGQASTCTATVTDTSTTGATTPKGTVTITETGVTGSFTTCTLAGTTATATCTSTFTPSTTGTAAITASYPGDASHTGSSGTASVSVNPVTTTHVILTFQGFNLDDFDNGVGQLQIQVNGVNVTDIPHFPGTGDYAPYTNN